MTWAAVAIGGGAIVGGLISSRGAQSAADTQAQATNNASGLQYQMYQNTQNLLNPYVQQGTGTLNSLNGFLQSPQSQYFQYDPSSDPGYQFRLNQGLQGIMSQQSAMGGGLNSGNTLKALMDYGQGQASQSYQQEFQNWLAQNNQHYNQLFNVAGMGENAAAGVGTAGMQTGSAIGQNMIGAGNAQAAATIAGTNAIGGAVQQAFSPYNMNAMYGYMNQPSNNGTGAYTQNGMAYANPSYYQQ